MFQMENFKVIKYQPVHYVTKEPVLTILDKEMKFGAVCYRMLKNPEYVRFLLDADRKMVAVQGMNRKGKDTTHLRPDKKSKNFGIYGQSYVGEIRGLMPGWKCGLRYNVTGTYYEEENVLLFDLNTAVESVVRSKAKSK